MSPDIFPIYPSVMIEPAAPCEKLVPGGHLTWWHHSQYIGVYLQCLGTGPKIIKKNPRHNSFYQPFPKYLHDVFIKDRRLKCVGSNNIRNKS